MTKPLNIILIEDNIDHADLIMNVFKENAINGFIFHIQDGEDALDFMYRRGKYSNSLSSPRPDLILLDLRLPKIDGIEVLQTIKNDVSLHQIPVVVLTTSDAESDIALAYENNANSYLVKPVDFSKLSKLLKSLGYYWFDWNKYPDNSGI